MSLYKDALAMEEGSLQGRLVLFSMTTLTIYDLCLHIHKDVAFVWRRGPNIINVLYVINRYLWPVSFIMQDILVFPVNDLTCAYLPYFVNILRMILYIHWSVFSAFRTYALSHRNHLLSTTVFVLGAAFIAPNLYMLIGPGARTANSPPPSNCTTVGNFDPVLLHMLVITSRVSLFIADTTVVLLTWFRTGTRSPLLGPQGPRNITFVMLSNGILCFTFPMIMTIVLTVADSLAAKGAFSNIGGASNTSALIRDGITSILISRFLMDLCKLGSQEHGASGVPENELTTHVMIELSATSSALPSESCDRCYDPEHGYTSK